MKPARPKFRESQPVVYCGAAGGVANGAVGTVDAILPRRLWDSPRDPKYRVKFPSGAHAIPESDLAAVSTNGHPRPNGQLRKEAPPEMALIATQVLSFPQEARQPREITVRWSSPLRITTYDYPARPVKDRPNSG